MAVTVAPISARARTNCFWLAGKRGSMSTTCMAKILVRSSGCALAASAFEAAVHGLVETGLGVPGEVAGHAVLLQAAPCGPVAVGAERCLQRPANPGRIVMLEGEPGALTGARLEGL